VRIRVSRSAIGVRVPAGAAERSSAERAQGERAQGEREKEKKA
jgi:hypothetical protein